MAQDEDVPETERAGKITIPAVPANAVRRTRPFLGPRAKRLVASAVLAISAVGLVAGLWVYRSRRDSWSVLGLVAVDDDHAVILTRTTAGDGALHMVDGSGVPLWSAAAAFDGLEPPPLSLFAEAGVVSLGDDSAFALADGKSLWRRPPREGENPLRGVLPMGDVLFVRYFDYGVGVGIDAVTGVERFRVPIGAGVRFSEVPTSIVIEESSPSVTTSYAFSDGSPIAVEGKVCGVGDRALVFDGAGIDLVDPTDFSRLARTEEHVEVEAPRCGVYRGTIIVGDTTNRARSLTALDEQTLAVRWTRTIASPPPRKRCPLGASLPMAEVVPRYLPMLIGDERLFVDLENGEIASRLPATEYTSCSPGLVVHGGRAYEISEDELIAFAPDAPANAFEVKLALVFSARPSFAGSHVWVHDGERAGRLRLPDLVPEPGSEWAIYEP